MAPGAELRAGIIRRSITTAGESTRITGARAGAAGTASFEAGRDSPGGDRGIAEGVTCGVSAFPATVPEASFTLGSGGKDALAFTGIVKATAQETRAAATGASD